ncbi:ferric-dicitrate binding protein FerR (iron transport regulator) [Pedobacter sp. AK017]|uniref:FecR family protein n=1 Tax=Pedobacter sp. AK017 TaxID=2723073 RepID=UPI001613B3B5|nr:FecR family protein [Pedobacter sp. AK017]MBB5440323.1 ferric-dicitrate binding protein FerR (iron transport regulator) [Pedobacter sp. AK017]
MKLYAHQSVAEALTILNNEGQDCLPVYDDDAIIGKITYAELRIFANHDEKPGSISAAKLHFDLRTVLPAIRAMQTAQYKKEQKQLKVRKWTTRLSSAAVIAVVLFGFAWLLFEPINMPFTDQEEVLTPDSNHITLTFTNGEKIALNSEKDGVVIHASQLYYNDGSALLQEEISPDVLAKGIMVLNTPKSGMYQVSLPDGTKVWLNSSSQLSFPSTFKGSDQRAVQLTGEAYFEVAKSETPKHLPFIVTTDKQEIKVLGTHFNVNAYPNNLDIKTTLLEGRVQVMPLLYGKPLANADPAVTDPLQVMGTRNEAGNLNLNRAVILQPNQQAILTDQHITVKPVDGQLAIAWTKRDFTFRNMPLEDIMNVVAVWYDVDVVYQQQTIGSVLLGGSIQRSDKLADVLATLSLASNMHFKVEGKRIIVRQ